MEKNSHHKEKGIKIIDPKKIDYTFTGKDDPFNIKFSSYSNEKILAHQVNQKQKEGILID
jgi:hypothetical protein